MNQKKINLYTGYIIQTLFEKNTQSTTITKKKRSYKLTITCVAVDIEQKTLICLDVQLIVTIVVPFGFGYAVIKPIDIGNSYSTTIPATKTTTRITLRLIEIQEISPITIMKKLLTLDVIHSNYHRTIRDLGAKWLIR